MKIEGETSKKYLESFKKYVAENREICELFAKAQKPEHAIQRTNVVRNDTVVSFRKDLAQYLSDFTISCAARNWEGSAIDRAWFMGTIKALGKFGILTPVTFAVLVRIIDLAHAYAPRCGLSFEDAERLLKMYIF